MSTDNHATNAATAGIIFYKPKLSYQEARAKSTIPFFLRTGMIVLAASYSQHLHSLWLLSEIVTHSGSVVELS